VDLGKIRHEAVEFGPGLGRGGAVHPLAELLQGQPHVTAGRAKPLEGRVPLGILRADAGGWPAIACGRAVASDRDHRRLRRAARCSPATTVAGGRPPTDAGLGRHGYQGTCRLSQRNAVPITGRWCQPRAMTSPRIDSAAPRSRWRTAVA
jgi:hypothetical protein